MENKKVEVTGVGFCDLLLITFMVLKLTKVVDWSWWWVLSPLWMPVAIVILILTIAFVLFDIEDRKIIRRRYKK